MDATHLHCSRCRTMRPIRFEPLLPGEPSMGTCICCAQCREHAFTLIKPARFYCEICDEVQPGLLERVELGPAANETVVLLVCGGCFDGKTMLYCASGRCSAGAAPPARRAPGDRARRG